MYAIRDLCHRTDIPMGRHAFTIDLSPEFRDHVSRSGITQEMVDGRLARGDGRRMLDAAGYDSIFDPENCGLHADRSKPPGPHARPSYEPNRDLRIKWGEWGPENISVPGNACGLDITRSSFGGLFPGGVRLLPHNVDCWNQKYLLLMAFTEFADCVILLGREK